jgi:hypothetical protein
MSNPADEQAPTGNAPLLDAPADQKPSQQQNAQTYRQIAAAHIDTLSGINEQLPKLLAYFAATISQLTNNPIETKGQAGQPDTVKSRQSAVWLMSLYVGMAVKEIREELEKQINDLERYGVIPAKHPKYSALPGQGQGQATKHDPQASVKNGGYGNFDVGVLNAQAAPGQIGSEDVLDRVKTVVEDLIKRSGLETNDADMAVDG